ncbi:TetR/AcrR family transcriptional regulator [Plantactinospora sp. B24E8]|uniref:TetR/AcrR family transcriptional regulator n=1 Tax=Plantactinospora sp. B24E8 TaxID=3153567 RepID=UPI00325E50A2
MGRASRADAAKHRAEVVVATSKLLRERGATAMTVQELMAAAGLTHGGFYKHFGSKEELVGIAATAAFDEIMALLVELAEEADDPSTAQADLARRYLSTEHRDSPGIGCANTALATDAARSPADSPLRTSYAAGLQTTLERLTAYQETPGRTPEQARRRAIVDFATMVGALTLARATSQTPLSEEILEVVREAITETPPDAAVPTSTA